jgi:hypothetical protein
MALNLAPFGRWTLRDKAAQRRLALREMRVMKRIVFMGMLSLLLALFGCGKNEPQPKVPAWANDSRKLKTEAELTGLRLEQRKQQTAKTVSELHIDKMSC